LVASSNVIVCMTGAVHSFDINAIYAIIMEIC
jgi:hypothetical protein